MRIRFEPIDVEIDRLPEFEILYKAILKSFNEMHRKSFDELLPSIRTTYRVDDMGFPIKD